MKKILLIAALLASPMLHAADEYRVVYLPTITGTKATAANSIPEGNGVFLDKARTEALNAYARKGWELVAVEQWGVTTMAFLKRKR